MYSTDQYMDPDHTMILVYYFVLMLRSMTFRIFTGFYVADILVTNGKHQDIMNHSPNDLETLVCQYSCSVFVYSDPY